MKALRFLVFAVLALGMVVGCSKDDTPEEKQEERPDLVSLHLAGTRWQLVDILNVKTGGLRILEPHNPSGLHKDDCFSFTLENDTIGYGWTCKNGMFVNITGIPSGRYLNVMTMVGEGTDDCYYFYNIARLVDDCFYENDRLIFAYMEDKVRYQLRFKQVPVRLLEQEPDLSGPAALKDKLLGNWAISGQNDSYIYIFADNDTLYTTTRAGHVAYKWPYQAIAEDSIQIIRNWTTRNKVVFYSSNSVWIEDFLPSIAAVYPPMFGDALLTIWLGMPDSTD